MKFEYCIKPVDPHMWKEWGNIFFSDGSSLKALGEEGWELSAILHTDTRYFIFKKVCLSEAS